jgi:S1-C subfamily serine protease
MNHVPVNSLADYRAQVAKLKTGDDVLFRVARHGENDRVLLLFLAGSVPPTK